MGRRQGWLWWGVALVALGACAEPSGTIAPESAVSAEARPLGTSVSANVTRALTGALVIGDGTITENGIMHCADGGFAIIGSFTGTLYDPQNPAGNKGADGGDIFVARFNPDNTFAKLTTV